MEDALKELVAKTAGPFVSDQLRAASKQLIAKHSWTNELPTKS
jgi:hypothetical protein